MLTSGPSAVLVTGIQAAGKSTIARMLAEHFRPGAFVEGDLMWQLIVSGRVDMTPDPHPEAIRQLKLRYRNGVLLVDSLVSAGFTAVHADIILENDLLEYVRMVQSRPLRVIVLAPDPRRVVERELGRGTNAYDAWIPEGKGLEDAVREFHASLEATPPIGIRVDSSDQTPEETVREILDRWDEALV